MLLIDMLCLTHKLSDRLAAQAYQADARLLELLGEPTPTKD